MLLALSLPAAADDAPAPDLAVPAVETQIVGNDRLESFLNTLSDKTGAGGDATSEGSTAARAEAEFAMKVREMLALARAEVQRAASGPNPVNIRMRIRCASKQIVTRQAATAERAFTPALAWSAMDAERPTEKIVRRVKKACRIQLIRTPVEARDDGTQMRKFKVELEPIAHTTE